MAKPHAALDKEQRPAITRLKIRIGALDLFMPDVLKPEAMRWRTALRAAAAGEAMPELPPEASVVVATPAGERVTMLGRLGFRALGPQMLRVDLVERLARHAHQARAGKQAEPVDVALATSLGLRPEAAAQLMRDLGFRRDPGEAGWTWRGRARRRRPPPAGQGASAFAALAELKRG